jgi:hypothetical protein
MVGDWQCLKYVYRGVILRHTPTIGTTGALLEAIEVGEKRKGSGRREGDVAVL